MWFQNSGHVVKCRNRGIKTFFFKQIFVVKSIWKKYISQLVTVATLNLWRTKTNASYQKTKRRLPPLKLLSNGNLKLNSPNKCNCSKVLSNPVQITKENSRDKLPTINSEKTRQKGAPNVKISTESSNSDDIRNNSRSTNTKHIKEVFVLGDNMINHVQGWGITKGTDN